MLYSNNDDDSLHINIIKYLGFLDIEHFGHLLPNGKKQAQF